MHEIKTQHILHDFCINYCELRQNKPKVESHFEIPRRERLSGADNNNNNISFASQNLISDSSSNLDPDPKPGPVSENDSPQRIVTFA